MLATFLRTTTALCFLAGFLAGPLTVGLSAQDAKPKAKGGAKREAAQKADAKSGDVKKDKEKDPNAGVTPASAFRVPAGFEVELLYAVPGADEGSWVNLTVDGKGRLITSDQNGSLYRVEILDGKADQKVKVTPIKAETLGAAQGLLAVDNSLYVMINAYGAGGKKYKSGLYLLQDTDGDDQYDKTSTILNIDGAGEHGPHAIVKGPDGKIYFCAGNHTDVPAEVANGAVPKVWQEDHLLGRMPDARGHAATRMAPGGWVARMNPDGSNIELVSVGYRNEFDIAFNTEGELFTYDADMEWDVNLPWYRPTRINHVTSGSEYGWRNGTGKWPADYVDSLGSVVDIGPGSPTGIVFGTGAKFPAKYQRALFISDWSYGNIFAVQMKPDGSSYTGSFETFATAAPFPVTDLIVRPQDGAMYVTMGGRGTQSALYRISYKGNESTAPASADSDEKAVAARKQRQAIEKFHGKQDPQAVAAAMPLLGSADRVLRFAARTALEHQPVDSWRDQVVKLTDPQARILGCVALSRCGKPEDRATVVKALSEIDWSKLTAAQQVDLLRAYELCFLRLGKPSDEQRAAVLKQLDAQYPGANARVNRELAVVLVYLEAPQVIARTIALQTTAPTQEDQIHYAFCLREQTNGWTDELRQKYLAWFPQIMNAKGGMSFGGFLENIRKVQVEKLSDEQRNKYADLINAKATEAPVSTVVRAHVRKWTVDEALAAVEKSTRQPDLAKGQDLFANVQCFKCHRLAGQGGILGPDLTGAGGRFSTKDLMVALIEPSLVVSDQYAATQFVTTSGQVIVGKIVNLNGNNIQVMTNMLDPSSQTGLKRDDIEEMSTAKTSMMPEGLLDTMTADDLVDLIGYLKSGGKLQ